MAAGLHGSVHAVWRVLQQEVISLQRQPSWCVSTDKQFAAKAADRVGLYLNRNHPTVPYGSAGRLLWKNKNGAWQNTRRRCDLDDVNQDAQRGC